MSPQERKTMRLRGAIRTAGVALAGVTAAVTVAAAPAAASVAPATVEYSCSFSTGPGAVAFYQIVTPWASVCYKQPGDAYPSSPAGWFRYTTGPWSGYTVWQRGSETKRQDFGPNQSKVNPFLAGEGQGGVLIQVHIN
jgi:hypothetical protein